MNNFKYNRLNKDDAVVLLVDHQAGLLSLVRDIEPDKFKNNALALADLASSSTCQPSSPPASSKAPTAR